MRPSGRPRNKNRNNGRRPNPGNVINRVFDSSGPEGKVRGTPQQIIDKYNQLARDAQLSNDRVATENFQQHAEHYLRLLAHAQKEQEARREQQEKENRGRNGDRERNRIENGPDTSGGNVSDLEKDTKATSGADGGKNDYEAIQENNPLEKSSSGSDDNDRSFKANRQKRSNNIKSDAIDNDDNSLAENTSKEAAE